MPVQVAQHAGFCMGVRRAVMEAMKAASTGEDIVTFGQLVHNPEVIDRLSQTGVPAVDTVAQATGKTVIIRSHGVSPEVLVALRKVAGGIIDLTCPFVNRLHDTVAAYSAAKKGRKSSSSRRP